MSSNQPPRLPAEKRQIPMWTQSGRAPANAREFVERLVEFDASSPLTEENAREALRKADISPRKPAK